MAFSEQEQLQCAYEYLQKLAEGIHPITDKVLLDLSKKEDKRLARLFGYCALVMAKYMDMRRKSSKAAKAPFYLSAEQKAAVEITEVPVSITAFVAKINELTDDNVDRLRARSVTGWLLDNGFLHYETVNGQSYRVPTPEAAAIGISTRTYTSNHLEYPLNVYDKFAQRFIIDHLEDIVQNKRLELSAIKDKTDLDIEGKE